MMPSRRKVPTQDSLLDRVDVRWRPQFLEFIQTGEATQEFLDYIDANEEIQQVLDEAFNMQVSGFERLAAALTVGETAAGTAKAGANGVAADDAAAEAQALATVLERVNELSQTERNTMLKKATKLKEEVERALAAAHG